MKSYFSRFLHRTLSHSGIREVFTSSLSLSDLFGESKLNKVANLSHLDYRVKFENDRKGKDVSLKFENDSLCTGRSMVEMLGVLAIIGVLSVGAIAGYSKAMMKYKLNQHAQAVSMLINNVLQLKGQLQYEPDTETCYGELFKKMNLLPDGINYVTNCGLTEKWFNGNISIYYNNSPTGTGQNNFGGLIFSLPVSSQGEEICRNILFAAKENAANLWQVELVKRTSDSVAIYPEKALLGNNYCEKDEKCLNNMTLNDTDVACNICDGESCSLYVLYE